MTPNSTQLIRTLPMVLGWVVVLAMLPRYLRYRWRGHDRRVATSWHILALLALAMTVEVPAVGTTLDRVTRLPNLALWLGNCLILGIAQTGDELLALLADGTEHAQRASSGRAPRLLLAVAIVCMAVLLAAAGLRSDLPNLQFPFSSEPTTLAAYELINAAALGYIALQFVRHGIRLARRCVERLVKVGVLLTTCGAAWAFGYAVLLATHGCIALVFPAGTGMQLQTQVHTAGLAFRAMAIGMALVGVTLPEVAQWARRATEHFRTTVTWALLRPLWRAVTDAVPEVVLPTALTWWRCLTQPTSMELLLNRHVVEILDGRRMLLARQIARSGAASHDVRADAATQPSHEPPSRTSSARAEARRIAAVLGYTSATTASEAATHVQIPQVESDRIVSYQQHIRHLVSVSVCLLVLRCRTRAVRRIGVPSDHAAHTKCHARTAEPP